MNDEAEPTVVIFRRWPAKYGLAVIAIFPEIDSGNGNVLMYEHVGQHGGGDYQGVMRDTERTQHDDPDVVALKAELESIGYTLRVLQRANYKTMRSKT